MFSLEGVRDITADNADAAAHAMVTCQKSPTILIKANGVIKIGSIAGRLLDFDGENDILLFVWAGNWKTDVFVVTPDFIKKYYLPKREEYEARVAETKRINAEHKRKMKAQK